MTDQPPTSTPAGWYPNPEAPGTQRYYDGTSWTDQTAPLGQTPTPGKKKGGAAKVLIPIAACVALAVVVVAVAALAGSDDEGEASPRVTTSIAPAEPASDGPDDTAGPEPAADPEPQSEPEADLGSREAPLAIGTGTRIGDYEVTVTAVNLDATAEVTGANTFNSEPTNGQYALVALSVTYVGDDEGNLSFDLGATLQGGNGVQYDDYECGASLDDGRSSAPTLTNGGSATYRVCMDIPAEAVDGATLFVEENLSFDETRAYWATS